MRKLAIVAIAMLPGCAVVNNLPTLRYCQEVEYHRVGQEITINARCIEPVDPAFKVSLPGVPVKP